MAGSLETAILQRKCKGNKVMKKNKSTRGRLVLNIFLILLGVLCILAAAAYLVIGYHFKTRFFPNTVINGMDCSNLEPDTVAALIKEQSMEYQVKIIGRDDKELGTLTAKEVGLNVDVTEEVRGLQEAQNWLEWIMALKMPAEHSVGYSMDFDTDTLNEALKSLPAMDEKQMEEPKDAYISEYISVKKAYEIIPETRGTKLNKDRVLKVVEEAIAAGEDSVYLDEAGCYEEAVIKSDDKELTQRLEKLNILVGTQITYDWNGADVVLDGDTIREWILDPEGEVELDEEAVAEFVKEQAQENDTYGKKRKFTTTAGTALTLASGAYGWKTDKKQETAELIELIKEGAKQKREPVYSSKGASKGQNDIGSSYVEIDLTNQHLYLYISGSVVLESDFVSGNMSKGYVTPPGVFGLTYKTKNAVLRGADYETPVNYWMPFNGNIGMHDATWRSSFGGDIYLTRGSHGCINLPLGKAADIYSYMSTGFPVVCYYY